MKPVLAAFAGIVLLFGGFFLLYGWFRFAEWVEDRFAIPGIVVVGGPPVCLLGAIIGLAIFGYIK